MEFFAKLPKCLIGIEACASSHYWARELITQGHEVKLMPAQYVKPYVKRGKNDAADAEAICEAVTRPTMRFVGVKTVEQQSVMMLAADRRRPCPDHVGDRMGDGRAIAPIGNAARQALRHPQAPIRHRQQHARRCAWKLPTIVLTD